MTSSIHFTLYKITSRRGFYILFKSKGCVVPVEDNIYICHSKFILLCTLICPIVMVLEFLHRLFSSIDPMYTCLCIVSKSKFLKYVEHFLGISYEEVVVVVVVVVCSRSPGQEGMPEL